MAIAAKMLALGSSVEFVVKATGLKKKEIAAKALEQGFTVEQVMKLTGLSKAVVGKLGKKAKNI